MPAEVQIHTAGDILANPLVIAGVTLWAAFVTIVLIVILISVRQLRRSVREREIEKIAAGLAAASKRTGTLRPERILVKP